MIVGGGNRESLCKNSLKGNTKEIHKRDSTRIRIKGRVDAMFQMAHATLFGVTVASDCVGRQDDPAPIRANRGDMARHFFRLY